MTAPIFMFLDKIHVHATQCKKTDQFGTSLVAFGKNKMKKQTNHFFTGVRLAVPVVLGYIPIAISFGVLAGHYHFHLFSAVLMSATVFAGAAQFLAVEMSLTDSVFEIALVVFLVNLRHLIMVYSLLPQTSPFSFFKRVAIFSGITDETYALIALSENESLKTFAGMLGLVLASYLSWVSFTALGIWFSSFIPEMMNKSMGIALYALFVALLVQALLNEPKYILLVVFTIFTNITLSALLHPTAALFMSITIVPALYVFFTSRSET